MNFRILLILAVSLALSSCGDSSEPDKARKASPKKSKSEKVLPLFEDRHPVKYKGRSKESLKTYDDYLQAATDAELQNAYTDCLEFAKKALVFKPDSGIAYYYCGKCEMAAPVGDTKKGIANLNKAIELGYENPDLYEYLAVYYTGQKELEKAVKALDRALVLAPKRSSYYKFRGSLLRQLGRIKDAEKDYDKIVTINNGKVSNSFFTRGRFYESVERYEDALKDYKTAASLPRPKFMVLKAIPQVLVKMGKIDEAIEQLNKVIEIDSYDDDALTFRGKLYAKQKKYDQALKDFSQAIQNSPRYASATYLARAEVYDKMGKPEKAKKDRESASNIKARPAEIPVYSPEN